MFEMEEIGIKICELRKKEDLTQSDLADRLGVTYQAVSNWERGKTMPDLFRLKDLAHLFGVAMDYFMSKPKDQEKAEKIMGQWDFEDLTEVAECAPFVKPSRLKSTLKEEKHEDEVLSLKELVALAPFMRSELLLKKILAAKENLTSPLLSSLATAGFGPRFFVI